MSAPRDAPRQGPKASPAIPATVCAASVSGLSSKPTSSQSTAIMTLDALMTAEAALPSTKPSDAAEALVMMETISTPGAISRVTSQLTAPSTTLATFPFSTLRALICMAVRIVSNGSRHSNRIAIEIEPSHHCRHLRTVLLSEQCIRRAPIMSEARGQILRRSSGSR